MTRLSIATAATTLTLLIGTGFAPAHAVIENGGPEDDRLDGTAQRDVLRGLQGDDRLFGYVGNDRLVGGLGNDRLDGGRGVDHLVGQSGNDRINSGTDRRDDIVSAGLGNDKVFLRGGDEVYAGGGDDQIIVAYPAGDLYIDCGNGTDSVVLNQKAPEKAYIIDCETVEVVSAG